MEIVKSGKHKGCVRGFVHTGDAWYKKSALAPDVLDDVMFGFYAPEAGSTGTGEMGMRWYEQDGKAVPRLEVYDDGWHALNEFSDVTQRLAALDNQGISPKQFCEILLECGFLDMTERVRDVRHWLGAV
jgi:hypothetical protein